MRILLVFLLGITTASAQTVFFIKDSARINLVEGLPTSQPFDTARQWQKTTDSLVYIISEKDVYGLFGYTTSTKFHSFDFSSFHIMGEYRCLQCMTGCRHEEGREACHRNRCMYSWVWWKRDNKKAFREIPVTVLPGHSEKYKVESTWLRDTLINDADSAIWLTTGHGDCHATFRYKLFEDTFTNSLILYEHNFWGGCRAGGEKAYTIRFKMPAGIMDHRKHTILEEKYNEVRQ